MPKTAEHSTTTANPRHQQPGTQPFFGQKREKGNSSFLDNSADKQTPFFSPNTLQPKLKIGAPNDKYEAEADRMADKVVRQLNSPASESQTTQSAAGETTPTNANTISPASTLQPKAEEELQQQEELSQSEQDIQRKPIFESAADPPEDNTLQRSGGEDQSATPDLENRLASSKGKGSSLPEDTRSSMESSFGQDFSGVRVHTGSESEQMNQDLGSHAFTHGNDIYFNRGKYDTSSTEGNRLLAHELTHTAQQGASKPQVQTNKIQKQDASNSAQPINPSQLKPTDISSKFEPDQQTADYLAANHKKYMLVPVRMGKLASGEIKVRQEKKAKEPGSKAGYKIKSGQGLDYSGIDFLNRLKGTIDPVIALKASDPNAITGFLSFRKGKTVWGSPKDLLKQINKQLEPLGLLGIEQFNIPAYENKVENGTLTLMIEDLKTSVAGYIEADGKMGMVGQTFVFSLNANVDVAGLASGSFSIERDEKGQLKGEGEIETSIGFATGKIKATYDAGDITIQGTVGIQSDKFSGEINILVGDKSTSRQTMLAALGVEEVGQEAKKGPDPKAKKKKSKDNQVIVGWGNVTVQITPWLEGKADIGVDHKGQVTIIGEVAFTEDITLMEQKGKKIELFKVEVKAGYGVPLVGQVGLFASIEMFINAGFGPLLLKDVKMTGRYSTDPSIMTEVAITGTLNINAFAIIGLTAEAGVFLTLIGHDIKAGISVTAAAGIKAYAEATPTFEYKEKPKPEGGSVGESRLKGHFEAAAQLFLMLGGSFFVELDSPWWSPAPDKRWDYPMGEVEYPLGDMGIGGDVDWLVGSEDPPELKFQPVDFSADKFTADVMADPPPGKGGGKGGEQDKTGKFEDKGQKGDKKDNPDLKKDNKGLDSKKKKEDPSKWPDQKRYMTALGKIGDIGDASKKKPMSAAVVKKKVNNIKKTYKLEQVQQTKKDDTIVVKVRHKNDNNHKQPIEIKLMSEAERLRLLELAGKDFITQLNSKGGEEKAIAEADAKAIAADITKKHSTVLETIKVKDAGDKWGFIADMGDVEKKWPAYAKKGEGEKTEGDLSDYPPEKAAKISAGIADIPTKEKQYLTEGKITKEEAEQVAAAIKKAHPVFSKFEVEDGSDSWDYYFEASKRTKAKQTPKDPKGFPLEDSEIIKEVGKIKNQPQFKGKTFKMLDLKEYLVNNYGIGLSTANRRIASIKRLNLLFVSESEKAGSADSNKDASFDQSLLKSRVVSPVTNRSKYGYKNPEKTSKKGMRIMVKGLLKDAKYGYKPGNEKVLAYLMTKARFYDKKNNMIIDWDTADLGHATVSAREHWNDGGGAEPNNKPGHTQTRSQNTSWNQNEANFHGPEEKHLNRKDNKGNYKEPGPPNHPNSHTMWWDPSDPDYQG